jgi:hypothetical protein
MEFCVAMQIFALKSMNKENRPCYWGLNSTDMMLHVEYRAMYLDKFINFKPANKLHMYSGLLRLDDINETLHIHHTGINLR